jgi:hypothetical protein
VQRFGGVHRFSAVTIVASAHLNNHWNRNKKSAINITGQYFMLGDQTHKLDDITYSHETYVAVHVHVLPFVQRWSWRS